MNQVFAPLVKRASLTSDATFPTIAPVVSVVDTPIITNNTVTFVGDSFVRLQGYDMDLPAGAADKSFEMSFATYAEYGLVFLKGNAASSWPSSSSTATSSSCTT